MKLCKLIPISLAAFLLLTGCGSGKSNIEDYLKEEMPSWQDDGGNGQCPEYRQC